MIKSASNTERSHIEFSHNSLDIGKIEMYFYDSEGSCHRMYLDPNGIVELMNVLRKELLLLATKGGGDEL